MSDEYLQLRFCTTPGKSCELERVSVIYQLHASHCECQGSKCLLLHPILFFKNNGNKLLEHKIKPHFYWTWKQTTTNIYKMT
jgi:hypothetical protein